MHPAKNTQDGHRCIYIYIHRLDTTSNDMRVCVCVCVCVCVMHVCVCMCVHVGVDVCACKCVHTVDCFYIALFSTLEQTHCACM